MRICAANDCAFDVWAGAGVAFAVNGVAATWVAFLAGPWVAGIGALRRRPASVQKRPPRGGRSGRVARRLAFLLLATLALAPIWHYGPWFGPYPRLEDQIAPPPRDIREAAPAGRPGTMPVAVACSESYTTQMNPLLPSSGLNAQLRYAQRLLATDDPALRIFGQLVDDGVRSGRTGQAGVGARAADRYCGFARGQP